jgi:hypothetical protein
MTTPVTVKFLAKDAMYIAEKDLPKFSGKRSTKYKVIHDHLGEIGTVTAYPVFVEDTGANYLADTKTGSIYSMKTMRCMTGLLELKK